MGLWLDIRADTLSTRLDRNENVVNTDIVAGAFKPIFRELPYSSHTLSIPYGSSCINRGDISVA